MDYKTVPTSDDKTAVALSAIRDIQDFLGRKCQMTYQTNQVETPYGPRFQTTVYLYPVLENGKGQKAVFVGTTIQAPGDSFSYDAGLEWALFRAGEDMLARFPGNLDAFFSRLDYDNWRIEKFLHRWSRRVLLKLYFDKQAPIQDVYALMSLDELKAEVQRGV